MPDTLTKLTYQTFQQSKSIFGLAHKTLSRELMKIVSPMEKQSTPIPGELIVKIQELINNLLETDWEDASS